MSIFGRKSSSGTDQPVGGVSTAERDQELQTILSHLKDKIKGVPVQDRRYHFTTYPLCFIGREAVDWFVDNKYAKSRSDAVELGQRLFKAGYIQHVTKDHSFKDEKLFYKFLTKADNDQGDKDKTPKKGTGSTSDGAGAEKRKKTSILAFFIGEDDDDPEPPAPLVPAPQPSASKQDRKEYMKTVAMRMQAKQLVLAPEENGKEFDPTATVHRRAAAQLLGTADSSQAGKKSKASILDGGLFDGPSSAESKSPMPSPTASPSSSLGPSAGADVLKSSGHSSGSAGSSPSGSLKVPSKKSVKIAEAVADARAVGSHRRNPSNDADKESSRLSTTPDNGGVATPTGSKPTLRRQSSIAKEETAAHQRSSSSGTTGAEVSKNLDDKEDKDKRRHHRSKSVQVTLPENVSVMVAGSATPVKDNPARPRSKGEDVKLPATLPAGVLPSLAQQEVEIHKLIGRGATGKVYKAVVNKELRAMKVLSMVGLDPKKQKKVRLDLKMEVDIIGSLPHNNIVQYYGLFYNKEAQELSLLMEFVDGLSVTKLAEYQRFHHPADKSNKQAKITLAPSITAQIILQVLQALVYLQDHRVIHRDLKPDNLLVDKGGVVKLIDFGMSAQLAATQSHRNSAVGTPWYVAPEVIMGENYAFEADIWSVGCTVLELVTGRPPFAELNAVNALSTMAEEDPEIPDSIEANCKSFLRRCIVRKTTDRASAAELIPHTFVKSAASLGELSKLVNLSMLYATPEP